MAEPLNDDPCNEPISKTRRKKAVDALQVLGKELTTLSSDTLQQMALPKALLIAILDYKRFSARGAKKRQEQYIGRLMRDIDPEPIRQQLAGIKGESAGHIAWLHRLGDWRERLLKDDAELMTLLYDFPNGDAQQLHTLIRNARKEQQQQKPPRSFRQLFQILKEMIPESYSTSASHPITHVSDRPSNTEVE